MLYNHMHLMICARAVSALGPPVTHLSANETRNRRSLGSHLLSHGVKFHLALKAAANVFWLFQELLGNSTPNLPARAHCRRPLAMPVVRPLSSGP